MTTNNDTCAYIVHFENERKRADLSYFLAGYANDYGTQDEHGVFSDSIANAKTLDLDALRLVVEAAKLSIGPVFEIDFGLSSAIKKIEAILK